VGVGTGGREGVESGEDAAMMGSTPVESVETYRPVT
jgi:hypothetical protein